MLQVHFLSEICASSDTRVLRVSPSTPFNAPGSCAAGATSKTERPRERALGERNEGWARPWAGVLKVAGVFLRTRAAAAAGPGGRVVHLVGDVIVIAVTVRVVGRPRCCWLWSLPHDDSSAAEDIRILHIDFKEGVRENCSSQ